MRGSFALTLIVVAGVGFAGCADSDKTAERVSRLEDQLAAEARQRELLAGEIKSLSDRNAALGGEVSQLKQAVAKIESPGLVTEYDARPILKFLGHSNSSVRNNAAQLLKYLADPASIDPLVTVASSRTDAQTRVYAVQALSAFTDERVEGLLARLAGDQDATVRRAVYQAMGQVATPKMLTALLQALAVEQKRPLPSGYSYNYQIQQIVTSLGSFTDVKAGRAILKLLGSPDKNTARYAAQASARIRSRELVPDIIDFLRKAPAPKANDSYSPHRYLIQALQQLRDPRAAKVLVELLGCRDGTTRQYAANALTQLAARDSAPGIAAILETGSAPDGPALRSSTIRSLINAASAIGDGRLAKGLIVQLGSSDSYTPRQAAQALSQCVDPGLTAKLIEAWEKCTDQSLKTSLKSTLGSGAWPARWIDGDKAFAVDKRRLEWMLKNRGAINDARPQPAGQQEF